ncbi:MAG TPA: TlpA disulfide reductase family protein [Chitinophagaceae bacterium]|nr:TlpA disulfide reductase family protein [Chitinophagaceae bacterium]
MKAFFSILFFISALTSQAQQGWWKAQLHRDDGNNIVFTFEWKTEKGKPVWYIHNAAEKIKVTDIKTSGDSIMAQMPLYESQFRFIYRNNELKGIWVKGAADKTQLWPFSAERNSPRFRITKATNKNISGRWAVIFSDNNVLDTSVAEFRQQGNKVTGTFLTNTGDYRYLEGVVNNDSLFLSCFDGSHSFLFLAKVESDKKISGGWRFSGVAFKEQWTAVKDARATVPMDASKMYLRKGEEKFDFTFNDLDGNPVSINDDRFKNKVVVIQIMGSWCPNCVDETAFLSDYYNKNRKRGVEIVALAYEYSTDVIRSRISLRKFQQRFNVQYPMLITGVTVNDSLRTEKTLPQVTPIKTFPSMIILDKKGKVRKLDASFYGPGSGQHYFDYIKKFEASIDALLKEN